MNRWAALALATLALVLGYTAFQWGGVVRTGRYEYLLVVGLLAMLLSVFRSRNEWSPLLGGALRWTVILLPAYALLQVVPLPMALLRVLSPARAQALDALAPIGARVDFASLSVFPAGTFQYFLLVCAYLVVFLLARKLTWTFRDRRWLVIWPVLTVAGLEAALGLSQYFAATGEQVRWGTYANHNHYAGFLEMALPFAVMVPVVVLRGAQSWWNSSAASALAMSGASALAALIFSAIIFSFSRMAFIGALSSLLAMATLLLGSTRPNWAIVSRKRRRGRLGFAAALVLAGFVFLPPEKLVQRFAEFVSADGRTGEGRTHLWTETIPLIKTYPAFGCGLGGYETAFSRFKISGVLVTDDYAHNDYLQLLAELGAVGFAIAAALAFSVARTAVRGAVKSDDSGARYFAVACVGSLSAIAVHNLADFNLYIPANAFLLAWIAGAAVATELRPPNIKVWKRIEVPAVTAEQALDAVSHQTLRSGK